jgi:hypothetical protein
MLPDPTANTAARLRFPVNLAEEALDAALTSRSVADFALARGPPTNTIDMGANKKGLSVGDYRRNRGSRCSSLGMLITVHGFIDRKFKQDVAHLV